ncbi:MAG: hypothetical protein ACRCTI_05285 [Beijerinckiaceae bacterium]
MMANRPEPTRARVITEIEADAVVQAALDALEGLDPIILEETALLKAGKIRPAMELAPAKSDAAQRYQRALEDVKANAIALGRFAPPSLKLLRLRHEAFAEVMALNMAVIGTTRTVSESLVRELAANVGNAQSPQGYGAFGQRMSAYRPEATPLAVSRQL